MNRVWRNIVLYLLVAQPISFLCVWIISESEGTASAAFRRLGLDLAAYVGLFVGSIWTTLVVPAAFLSDRLTRAWPSAQRRRVVLIVVCAATAYLSTLLFAYGLALFPMVVAFMLGCATYGAAFRMSGDTRLVA